MYGTYFTGIQIYTRIFGYKYEEFISVLLINLYALHSEQANDFDILTSSINFILAFLQANIDMIIYIESHMGARFQRNIMCADC